MMRAVLLLPLTQSFALAAEAARVPIYSAWWLVLLIVLLLWLAAASNALSTFETWRYQFFENGELTGRWTRFYDQHARYSATLLVLFHATGVAITVFTLGLSAQVLPSAPLWLQVTAGGVVSVALLLVFGELLPKGIVTRYAGQVAHYSVGVVALLTVPLRPVVAVVTSLSTLILRALKIDANTRNLVTESELRHLLKSAEETGVLEGEEQDMIQGVIDLEETTVREIMTPRVDVSALHVSATFRDIIEVQRTDGFSRIPVYDESIDNIIGIVYARDLLDLFQEGVDLDSPLGPLILPVQLVPESLSIRNLLNQMRQKKNHFAVVIDEFGGTAGVVTLEDIIEEITGEIHDEYDEEEIPEITYLGNNMYHILGSTHIEDVKDLLDVEFDPDGDYDTIAGYVIAESGEIPKVGYMLEQHGYQFFVVDADERRVNMIEVRPSPIHVVAIDSVAEGS